MSRINMRCLCLVAVVLANSIGNSSQIFGQELVDLTLESKKRGYDSVTAPLSGAKQDFAITKPGIMTVLHVLEPHPAGRGGYRLFPINPKNGPDWEARHHFGATISVEQTPKEPKKGDRVTIKTIYRVWPTPPEIKMAARLVPPHEYQSFQIGNRGEQLAANQQLKIDFIPAEDYVNQDKTTPAIDISGNWKNGDPFNSADWTFTPKGIGEYDFKEKGFEDAVGTAKVRGKKIYIDYTTSKDKKNPQKGIQVIEIDDSNKNGSGWWITTQGGGVARIWTSMPAKPITPAPQDSTPKDSATPSVPPKGEPAAVTKFTVQVGVRRAKPGEIVQVPVYLLNPGGVMNLNTTVSYTQGVATTEGKPSRGNVLGTSLFEANAVEAGIVRIGFAGSKPVADSGTISHIAFKAVGKPGDRTILKVAVATANGADGKAMTAETIDGEVLIVGTDGKTPGDADGDGVISAGDALAALKMSVKLIPEDKTLDMDSDAKVTSNDARLILLKAVGK